VIATRIQRGVRCAEATLRRNIDATASCTTGEPVLLDMLLHISLDKSSLLTHSVSRGNFYVGALLPALGHPRKLDTYCGELETRLILSEGVPSLLQKRVEVT
jgi:hypothetical protein